MQLQERLEQFGVTDFPKPKSISAIRPASLLERLTIFYHSFANPVKCPQDESRVRPTGRIIIEGQITDPQHGSYKGFKSAEGECRKCSKPYAVAGTSCIGVTSLEELSHKETLLNLVDTALGLLSIPKGEVYSL